MNADTEPQVVAPSAEMRTDDDGSAVNRPDGRPISQWSRLAAGRSDDLGTAGVTPADPCH